MAPGWVEVDQDRRPRAFDRLEAARAKMEGALEFARLCAYPKASTSIGTLRRGTNEWTEPDAGRRRYRALESRYMKRVSRAATRLEEDAAELEAILRGDNDFMPKRKRMRCGQCNRWARKDSTFCDGCGSSRLEEI